MKQKTFNEIVELNKKVIEKFKEVEQKPWTIEANIIELAKQVGDLSKHVMVQEKYYLKAREKEENYITSLKEISDELADIFFCLVRIADEYKIDLEKVIIEAREKDQEKLS